MTNGADTSEATTRSGSTRPSRATGENVADIWVDLWPQLEGHLVRYLTYLLAGDTYTAEDVAQETAVRLWQHPELPLADDQRLSGWLRTVARNNVIDRVRRRNVRPAEVDLGPGVDHPGPDPTTQVDDASAVLTMVSGLSPRHRDVILKVYVQDRTMSDVATDLGIPTGTVKSRCHNALHQLRATWADNRQVCA